MICRKRESLLPPDLLQLLLRPISEAAVALARLDERIARSPVGEGFLERGHFHEAHASLWVDGELVQLEDLVRPQSNNVTTPVKHHENHWKQSRRWFFHDWQCLRPYV